MRNKTSGLTKKELEVLRAIQGYQARNLDFPGYRGLGKELGYGSPQSTAHFIGGLVRKGFLLEKSKYDFEIVIEKAKPYLDNKDEIETVDVPMVLGSVPCGTAVISESCIEAKYAISKKLLGGVGNYFLVRAKGDSMNKAGVNDGDVLLVKSQDCAENGDMVVALIDGEVTMKRLWKTDGFVALMPKSTNKTHKPIIISDDCSIQGIVKTIFPSELFPR